MKKILIVVFALAQFSAHASRTPETYCVAKDGSVEVKIFNDTNRGLETEVSLYDGAGFVKASDSYVLRKDTSDSVNYISEELGLSINTTKSSGNNFRGTLNLASDNGTNPIAMTCRLSN